MHAAADRARHELERERFLPGLLEQRLGLLDVLHALLGVVVVALVVDAPDVVAEAAAPGALSIICSRSTIRRSAWRTRTSSNGARSTRIVNGRQARSRR